MLYEAIDDDTIELNVINCFVSRASSADAEKYWKLMKFFCYYFRSSELQLHNISMHYSWFCWFVHFFLTITTERTYGSPYRTIYIYVAVIYVHYNANITLARPAFNWTINYFLVISSANRVITIISGNFANKNANFFLMFVEIFFRFCESCNILGVKWETIWKFFLCNVFCQIWLKNFPFCVTEKLCFFWN